MRTVKYTRRVKERLQGGKHSHAKFSVVLFLTVCVLCSAQLLFVDGRIAGGLTDMLLPRFVGRGWGLYSRFIRPALSAILKASLFMPSTCMLSFIILRTVSGLFESGAVGVWTCLRCTGVRHSASLARTIERQPAGSTRTTDNWLVWLK
jgi:hypothetical protein